MLSMRSNLIGRLLVSNVKREAVPRATNPFLINSQPRNVISFSSPNQQLIRFASSKKERQKEEKRQLKDRERERLSRERAKERAEKEKALKREEERDALMETEVQKTPEGTKTEEAAETTTSIDKLTATQKKRQMKNKPKIESGAVLRDVTSRELDALDSNTEAPRITHEQLRELLKTNKDNVVIIDLRDKPFPGEPRIEGSNVIPTPRLSEKAEMPVEALTFSEELFQKKYNFKRPSKNAHIVFTSAYGRRSDIMATAAVGHGFTNAKSLYGGVILYNKYYNPKAQ